MKWIAFFTAAVVLAVGPARADGVESSVTCSTAKGTESCAFDIQIGGEINSSTLSEMQNAFAKRDQMMADKGADNDWLSIQIDSPGGSTRAAMEIGKLLRSKDAPISVGREQVCISACVLILAGATHRLIYGQVGIHRPYIRTLPSTEVDVADVRRSYGVATEQMRSYLRQMNISDRLADDMMLIPPEKVRFLSPSELAGYGLGRSDPVSDELADLQAAKKLGIDRITYLRRKALAAYVCTPTDSNYRSSPLCETEVLSGRRVERAPPCRDGMRLCQPRDREWNGRKINEGDEVTANGFLILNGK